MPTRTSRPLFMMLFLSLAGATSHATADLAGNVVRTSGNVTAAAPDSKAPHALSVGGAINEGDTITLAEGASVQLQMIDGALISLTGESALNIAAYNTTQGSKGNGKVSLLLKKGRFRTTTGNIKKDSYALQTPSAIIRIRGTVYDALVNPSNKETTAILREGAILVESTCNDVGTGNQQLLDVPGMGAVVTPCKPPGKPSQYADDTAAGEAAAPPPPPPPPPPSASP